MKQNRSTSFHQIILILLLTSFAITNYAFSQDKAVEIDKLLQKYHGYGQFNGSALVSESGKIILKKGYGLANMEWNIENKTDTKFRIGSITKQFTSMLIMQLVEEGKIELDAKITHYLPDYRDDTGDKVTIHHLLTHTSGIPSYTDNLNYDKEIRLNSYAVDELIKKFCSRNLSFEPGSRYAYNNTGYFLLGAIIEKVTGKNYETVLQERILDPTGMKNTGYDHHKNIIPNRAAGYEKSPGGYTNSTYIDMSVPFSAGSMFSTVEDLFLWDQALYKDKLLSNESKERMFKPFLGNYAYGWDVRKMSLTESSDSLQVISHGGGINGFHTLITRLIDDKYLIVLLNNTGGTSLNFMNRGIINILYNKPYEHPKKSIAEELFKTFSKDGISTAINHYYDLKKNHPTQYYFEEDELNWLGYYLLDLGKTTDAIEVFKLSVEVYPDSSNAYDSLGEAFMKNSQRELAIKNYKKSIELNPENTNAVEMLKKLN